MSLFKLVARAVVEGLIEAAEESSRASETPPQEVSEASSGNGRLRYAGDVHGAQGVVDVQITRFQNPLQDVFRIEGSLTTPVAQWWFHVDGHSGYGKFQDETVIKMEIDERQLAMTINPFDPPAPTYYFRRV